MNKTNNKSIILGLKILSILAFSLLVIPATVSASESGTNFVYKFDSGFSNPKPVIDSIDPSVSDANVGAKTITITGSGFIPNSVARVNGSNRSTTFIDSTHLLMISNSGDTYRTDGGFYITVFNGAPGGGFSNSAFFMVNKPVAGINTDNNYSSTTKTTTDTSNTYSNTTSNTSTDNSNLASSVILGSGSFLPSGLIQWILFAILILIIIIIARKIFGAKERYDDTPLKHA